MKSKNEVQTAYHRDRIIDRNALFMASISAICNNPKVSEQKTQNNKKTALIAVSHKFSQRKNVPIFENKNPFKIRLSAKTL